VFHPLHSPYRNKVEHCQRRVEVPLFLDCYCNCVGRCQILEYKKDLLTQINYMASVTKRSYVKMLNKIAIMRC
jgi:hypothetical protein